MIKICILLGGRKRYGGSWSLPSWHPGFWPDSSVEGCGCWMPSICHIVRRAVFAGSSPGPAYHIGRLHDVVEHKCACSRYGLCFLAKVVGQLSASMSTWCHVVTLWKKERRCHLPPQQAGAVSGGDVSRGDGGKGRPLGSRKGQGHYCIVAAAPV